MNENILQGKTILVVDDEVDLRDIICSEIEFLGGNVFQAGNISEAKDLLEKNKIDLIISDIRMPGGTGIELLEYVKAKNVSEPAIILITGFSDISIEDAYNKGAEALLNKPFMLEDLIKLAVRYTSPFANRFHEKVNADKVLPPPSDIELIDFGRGGVIVPIDGEKRSFQIGEPVKFNFIYDSHQFIGSGICRWIRPFDKGSKKAFIGLEFLDLNPSSLVNFGKIFNLREKIPYIPSTNFLTSDRYSR